MKCTTAPEYRDPDKPISEELEREAYSHYGRGLEPADADDR